MNLAGVADGYYETDLSGGLVVANDSLCRLFGCDKLADLSGDRYLHRMDEPTASHLKNVFRQAAETGKPIASVECEVASAGGEPRVLDFSVALLHNRSDEPVGFHGIVRDVTERRRAETQLIQRVNVLAVLQQVDVELNQSLALESVLAVGLNAAVVLSSADAGFIGLIDPERGVRLARSVGGFTEQWMTLDVGIIARAIRSQRPELIQDVKADPDYYADLADTRAEIAIPLIAHSRVIGVLNLETAAAERFTPQVFEYVQSLAARLTVSLENARLYEALQAQLDELGALYTQVSDLEQLKTDMIRVAAHDLRGPLAIVSSYVELLDEDLHAQFDDMHRLYIDSMRQALVRMTQMTSDILSLERLDASRESTLARVQLHTLLDHAIREHGDESREHNQQITLEAEPAAVYGDSTELFEAVTNLLSNAVKYTPDGGQIRGYVRCEGDDAVLEISDTGYGIPESELGGLFQPFHRVKTRETHEIDGTGLGLYLVKKIVERHGGTVICRSEYGKGSTFGFRLPLAK